MTDDRRNAIVTGAASGLGRAIALRLARDRFRIALVDVNAAGNEETLRQVRAAGGEGSTHEADVSQPAAWEQLNAEVTAAFPHLDLLVNNAGVAGSGAVSEYSIDDWHWILRINLNAAIYGCHYFIPWLKQNPRGSHIINIASLAAVASKPGMGGYNVAKAGVVSLSETLYGELKRHNVGVSVVCPSFFKTNLLSTGKIQPGDRRRAERVMERAQLKAEDVADAAVRAMYDKRLYVVVPWKARVFWRMKRLFPMLVCKLLARDWDQQLAIEQQRRAAGELNSGEERAAPSDGETKVN